MISTTQVTTILVTQSNPGPNEGYFDKVKALVAAHFNPQARLAVRYGTVRNNGTVRHFWG